MPISDNRDDREHGKFTESVAIPGMPAVAVTNPDGSNIGGSGGTSMLDDSAFTPGGSSVTPIGATFDDVSPDQVDEGDIGAVRMTQLRALHVNLRDAAGAELAVGGGTQYDEDTASAAAEKITMAGVVRKDTAATLVSTDGDRTELQVDGTGLLRSRIDAAIPAGANNIGDVDVLTLPPIPAGTNNIGDVDVLTQIGAANLANGQVSVTTTAGNVVASRATRRAVTIVNHGTTDVYLGVATVTTSNGILLTGTKGAAVTLFTTAAVQGIVAAGTQTVSYIEEYD